MVEAGNQAASDFSHPKSWEREGFLYGRYEVDFN
jgi:hypothetical protein